MSQKYEGASSGMGVKERMSRLQAALSRVNQALLRSVSKEDVLKKICDIMVQHAGFRIAWIGWLNPRTNTIVPSASAGEPAAEYLRTIKVTANGREEGQGPTGTAMRQGSLYVCNDFFADPLTRPWRDAAKKAGIQSSAAFPFTCGSEKMCGTLNLYSGEIDAFQNGDVVLLREIAADLSYRLAQIEEAAVRNKAMLEIGERDGMFRMFAEMADEVFWIMKTHPELIVYVNPAFERVWGMSAAELYGNPRLWIDSIHLDDRLRVIEFYSNWIQRIPGSVYDVEYRLIRPDGQMRWIHDRGFALYDRGEGGESVAGIAEDITERKMAEEDLRASSERYRSVLDNMLEGCMIIGFDWTYLYVNEAAARHGYQEKENLVGRSMLAVYPGIDKSSVFAQYEKCMEDRVPQTFESSYTFADGTTNWYEFRVAPVPEGIFVLSLDITPRMSGEG